MLNVMTSAPTAAFASSSAWRKLPAPESFVLVTGKTAAEADVANNPTIRATQRAQTGNRFMCITPGHPGWGAALCTVVQYCQRSRLNGFISNGMPPTSTYNASFDRFGRHQ